MPINKTKKTSKRHQPKGLTILHEDRDIIVVDKINGLLTVGTDKIKENTAYYLLNQYVRKGNQKSRNRVFIVHRLDRETSGVIVFAKTDKAKRFLQENWSKFTKNYYAVVHGNLEEKTGQITSYLAENSKHRMYSTDDSKKGKLAKTSYKVIKESKKYSLLEINLHTGRKNQIRVHLSDKKCCIVGDRKYGVKEKGIKRLALHATAITLTHPYSKNKLTFKTSIPTYFETLLKS